MRWILFEDDPTTLHLRELLAHASWGHLQAEGILTGPADITTCRSTMDVFHHLLLFAERDAEAGLTEPTVVIADMQAKSAAGLVGNLGARLLRAIAQDPDLGPRTRRILWTNYSMVDVFETAVPFLHAFASFRHEDSPQDALTDAVRWAMHGEAGEWEYPEAFPRALSDAEWSSQLRDAVQEELLGGAEPTKGDVLAATQISAGVMNKLVTSALEALEPEDLAVGRNAKANDFLSFVAKKHGLAGVHQARERVQRVAGGFHVNASDDVLDPAACDAALEAREEHFAGSTARAKDATRRRLTGDVASAAQIEREVADLRAEEARTWPRKQQLDPVTRDLVDAFLDAYRDCCVRRKATAPVKKSACIREVLGRPPHHEDRTPEVTRIVQEQPTLTDINMAAHIAYGVLRIGDVRADR